jgi:microsomal epoxide hydrolase
MNQRATAARHATLMAALGYDHYIAQGGDWGSIVAHHLAALDPTHCIGLHLNMLFPMPPAGDANPMAVVQPHEQRYLANTQAYREQGAGYFHQQRTKPQTLAYGLADSPAGWCAWITEKFHEWTDCQGDGGREIRNAVSWDALLGNISLYWFTNTIASSSRYYKEYGLAERAGASLPGPITVPTGVAVYPFDLCGCPRAWAETLLPLVHWFEAPRGGHFAAMEQPEMFAADLRSFKAALAT